MGATDRDYRPGSLPEVDTFAVAYHFEPTAETANQDLRALQAVTDTALSHLALDDLLPALLERISHILQVDNAAVLLLDETGQTLTVQAVVGLEEPVAEQVHVPMGQGFAGRIAVTRNPLVVDDVATVPIVNPLLGDKLRSLVGVPLICGGQVLGVLHVGAVLPRHFTPRDVQLLQQVADRMALAIDRARLYTREQQAREQAEAALAQTQASEHRFQQLVESNILGVVVSDTERVFEANDEYLRVVGYTREDLEAGRLRFDRLKSPDSYQMSEQVIQDLVTTGVSMASEQEYIRKDGSRVSVLLAGILMQRDPLRVASFVFDLTERKRLEQESAEQAEQLDRIFETLGDALIVYDAQGNLVRMNSATRRILGLDTAPSTYFQLPLEKRNALFDRRDARGRPVEPKDLPMMRALRGETLTGVRAVEGRMTTLDGREVETITSAVPLRDYDGRIVGAVGILRDQTEFNQLAREREEARAHELALEDTARHMDEFLATASHDLRTPLTVVKSRLQLALRRLARLRDSAAEPPDALAETDLEALHESLLAANQSTERLTRLVAMLFDVSRARSGTLELQLAPCDLATLVDEQVAAQQTTAPDRTIETVHNDRGVWVQADAARLSQVLSNYLSNALKYSPKDQLVTVRLEVVENWAVVRVADHGPGIPLEEQNRIWEWFHRVPGIDLQYVNGESSGSLGLGLHICKQLVELHPDGSVGVESVVGVGSTFWFRLPIFS